MPVTAPGPPVGGEPEAAALTLGVHVLLDLWGIEAAALDDVDALEALLVEAARAGGATIVDRRFSRFVPQGVSGVVVLAESHLAVHTWPEHGYAAFDVFTCGAPAIGDAIAAAIQRALPARGARVRQLRRGFPSSEG